MKSNWSGASGAISLALGLLLAGPAMAEISYTYVSIGYGEGDIDISESVVDTDIDARISTDSGGGFILAGSWQFYDNWHVFGEYSNVENDIEVNGTVLGVPLVSLSGEFDITRWRLGVGYGYPVREDLSVYGRFSYDYIEFDEFDISGLDADDLDTDDNGLGVEGGVRWLAAEPLEFQGYVRYTSVGEVDIESDDEFDDDILFGAGARYYFFDNRLGVQAGYEFGEINTWNIGARWQF